MTPYAKAPWASAANVSDKAIALSGAKGYYSGIDFQATLS
jgi:hypothetical protein